MALTTFLFDLDGTLVDTAPDFVVAANKLRQNHKLKPLPAEDIALEVSNGSIAITRKAMAIDDDHPRFDEFRAELLQHYEDNLGQHARLYPGMQAILDELQGHKLRWGVVTNKPLQFSRPLVHSLGLADDCAALVCPEHVTRTKPDPEPLHRAIEIINTVDEQVNNTSSAYIGDHRRDIDAGRAAGMTTIAAAYGYIPGHEKIDEWDADHIAASVEELHSIIRSAIST